MTDIVAVKTKNAEEKHNEKIFSKTSSYFKIAGALLAIALVIAFFTGLLPIAPITVATGSMEPKVNVGDVVIVCQTNPDDLKKGDIIQYQGDDFTVIHRICEIKTNDNGETYFVTKGDNNNAVDANPVTKSQVLGKVVLTVPYAGIPSLWLHSFFSSES